MPDTCGPGPTMLSPHSISMAESRVWEMSPVTWRWPDHVPTPRKAGLEDQPSFCSRHVAPPGSDRVHDVGRRHLQLCSGPPGLCITQRFPPLTLTRTFSLHQPRQGAEQLVREFLSPSKIIETEGGSGKQLAARSAADRGLWTLFCGLQVLL